jgi:RimJ/RimL family protein N-acetyltransferase
MMNMPVPTLDGLRIRLRPLRSDDADVLYALHSDPQVMRY